MAATPLVEVAGVCKDFTDGTRRVVVLKDISFAIERNQFVAILGPSGCGKTTLLRMLSGLDHPTSGSLRYEGQPIRPGVTRVGLVFQNFALMPWLDVLGNVALGLEARGYTKEQRNAKAEEFIDVVGLSGFENAYPRELSGGMKQRVGIARALATEPVLLCMDEPFNALDPLTAESLRGEVLQLWADPAIPPDAVAMVTHNVEEAVEMADRVLVLSHRPGTLLADVAVPFPRPRDRRTPEFFEFVDRIYKLIT